MTDFNEDLMRLRDLQDSQVHRPRMTFREWSQEQDRLSKAPSGDGRQSPVSPGFSPGVGMMGRYGGMSTSSFAPTGPANRNSGNRGWGGKEFPNNVTPQQFGVSSGVGYNNGPSKYSLDPPPQPPPWIDDVDMASIWYSPMEPVWPFGPPYYNQPREWNYPVGYNLNYVPARMGLYGILRSMRQSWGVLATVESTRMDQLLRIPWTIQRKDRPRASSRAVDQIRQFFRRPDGKLSYSQWSRKLLFDLFDLDAPSIYINRDGLGRPRYAEVLDGATIFPLIDDMGRRPDSIVEHTEDGIEYLRRQPAYQQIIYGLPMVNLSEDELIYAMMRPRPELPMFGYSPVEQIYIETMEAIRKTLYQLEFWRSGSMPELIVTVPDNWTPRQIATFQAHFDALLSGNLSLKSKCRFVPGGMKPFDIKNASGESLWSQRDEMLVRLACYAFSVSPTPFIRQTNRATAQNAQQSAEEEGLYPLMCHSADTEVLTENGWKSFEDLEATEMVATVAPETYNMEYHVPIQKFVGEANDISMVHFCTQGVDVLVTPEHEMLVRSKNAFKKTKVRAEDTDYAQYYFQANVNYAGGFERCEFVVPGIADASQQRTREPLSIEMDTWLQFLGYFIAEGGLRNNPGKEGFNLSQSLHKQGDGLLSPQIDADPRCSFRDMGRARFNAHYCDLSHVLAGLGVSSYASLNGQNGDVKQWNVSHRRIWNWLRTNVGTNSFNKRIPREFFSLSVRQLRILFTALMDGDGSWDIREGCDSGAYYTTSKGLADDVQELATLLGFSAQVALNQIYSNRFGEQECWRVGITVRAEHALSRGHRNTPASRSRVSYTGKVYCLNVPNHIFITRRNGKIGIHGNSWYKDDIMDYIIQSVMGMDDIEFVFLPRPEVDLEKQAKIHQIQINDGIRTRNEVRAELGEEPTEDGDVVTITTGAGVMPLSMAVTGQHFAPGAEEGQQTSFGNKKPRAEKPNKNPAMNRPQSGSPQPHEAPAGSPTPIHKMSRGEIDDAVRDVAKPSKRQKHAGNYRKGHIRVQGLSISIETPKGKKRHGHDQDGEKWTSTMAGDYGYIRGTLGADGDQIDCCIGPHPKSPLVFVVDQYDTTTGKFDEHKAFIGYRKPKSAMKAYFDSNSDGLGPDRLGSMKALSMSEFKNWLTKGNHKSPIAKQDFGTLVARRDKIVTKADTISSSTGLSWYSQGAHFVPRKRKKKKKLAGQSGPRWLELSE